MVWWIWLLIGTFTGALVGGIAVFAVARRRSGDTEVRRLERDLETYRSEVGDHFVRTAELVNRLTNDYRAVYEHLERGAYDLVGEPELRRRLRDVEADPVTLEYIGRRSLSGGESSTDDRAAGSAPAEPTRPHAASGTEGGGEDASERG